MSFKNVIRIENKKRVSGITKPVNYSTDEHIIGTWIDGSTLYEKTIDCGALLNNSTKSFPISISNLNVIVSYDGIAIAPTLGVQQPIEGLYSHIYRLNDTLNIATNTDMTAYNAYITIHYTKTN